MSKAQEKQDNENYSKNFTRVPNIIFVSYKHLTKEEKFLYCTLRQVYWDMKPRFVSTRELSELTGYSRSALANMLPHLHTCGLVHAEIRHEKGKGGNTKGHAKYHITIPDIWELNRKYFEASPEEQAAMDPSLKIVHEKDNQIVHQTSQNCPPNKPELSTKKANVGPFGGQSQARVERAKDKKDISKDTSERKNGARQPNDSTSEESFIHSSNFSSSFSSEGTKSKVTLTEDEQRIVDFGKKDLFKARTPEVNEKLKSECAELAPHIKTQEQFDSLLEYVRAKLKPPYHLKNMVNALNDWLQLHRKSKAAPLSSAVSSSMGVATAEWIAEQKKLQQRILEQEAAQGGNRISLKERQAQLLAGKKPTVGNRHLQPLPTSRREGSHHA